MEGRSVRDGEEAEMEKGKEADWEVKIKEYEAAA